MIKSKAGFEGWREEGRALQLQPHGGTIGDLKRGNLSLCASLDCRIMLP